MGKSLLFESTICELKSKISEALETIGIRFESAEALTLLKHHGFKTEGNIVFFNEKQIEHALIQMGFYEYPAVTQRKITGQLFYGIPVLLDDDTHKYRRVHVSDAVKMYQLGETSDLYGSSSIAIVDPEDNDAEDPYIGQMAMLLKYSDKYLMNGLRATATNSKNGDVYTSAYNAIHLVREVLGDTKEESVMTQIICPKSPLEYDEECILNIRATAEQGQKIILCPCSLTNLTGPSSILGVNIHDMALALAGIVYIQLIRPGLRVSMSTCSVPTDLRIIQPVYGTAEMTYISVVFYELCKSYRIPCSINAMLSDAAVPNYQSGVESLLTTMLPFELTDLDIAYCYPGLMAGFYCGSFEKVIYDEETMRYVNRIFKGISQKIDTNILKDMQKAMVTKTFLNGKTPNIYREENYLTNIFSKYGISEGIQPEKADIILKAKAEIKRRLGGYQLPKRTIEQKQLLQRFLPSQCRY